MEPLGLQLGAAGVPGPGFKLCSMFNHRGWSRAPQSLHFPSCKAQSAVCLRARQGDHPEGRAGWSWADCGSPPRTEPPPHPYASLLYQGLTPW